jgi:photosystem II stability/assembly factor-like uncharacterized protein
MKTRVIIILLLALASIPYTSQEARAQDWDKVFTSPTSITDFHFTSSQEGIVIGSNRMVAITHDGGNSFQPMVPDSCMTCNVNYLKAYFQDPQVGMLWATRTGDVERFVRYETINGGLTWLSTELASIDPKMKIYSIEASGKMIGTAHHYVNGDVEYIYLSDDFGLTWTLTDSLFGFMFDSVADVHLSGDYGMMSIQGYGVFGSPYYRTTDGGLSWNDFSVTGIDPEWATTLFPLGEKKWISSSVIEPSVYFTTNGGSEWSKVNDLAISRFGGNADLLFGDPADPTYQGRILRSTDGGVSWTQHTVKSSNLLMGKLQTPGENYVYLSDSGRNLYRSTTGGGEAAKVTNDLNTPMTLGQSMTVANLTSLVKDCLECRLFDLPGRLQTSELSPGFYLWLAEDRSIHPILAR